MRWVEACVSAVMVALNGKSVGGCGTLSVTCNAGATVQAAGRRRERRGGGADTASAISGSYALRISLHAVRRE